MCVYYSLAAAADDDDDAVTSTAAAVATACMLSCCCCSSRRDAAQRRSGPQVWYRTFGPYSFTSRLRPDKSAPGCVLECFGPLSFRARLLRDTSGGLRMCVEGAYCFGVRLPAIFTPTSDAREFVDAQGRFNFDVGVAMPIVGRVVRARGS